MIVTVALLCVACIAAAAIWVADEIREERRPYVANDVKPMNDGNKVSENTNKDNSGMVESSAFIGEEKAREIALSKSGLNGSEVHFDRVELDEDDGIWHYEVEFKSGSVEYDAEVKADDGTILKWDVDYND